MRGSMKNNGWGTFLQGKNAEHTQEVIVDRLKELDTKLQAKEDDAIKFEQAVREYMDNHNQQQSQFMDEWKEFSLQLADNKITSGDLMIKELDKIQFTLGEKIHTENVKCYRNIQSLFEEQDKKNEEIIEVMKHVEKQKGMMLATFVCSCFSSICMATVICIVILFQLGIV